MCTRLTPHGLVAEFGQFALTLAVSAEGDEAARPGPVQPGFSCGTPQPGLLWLMGLQEFARWTGV